MSEQKKSRYFEQRYLVDGINGHVIVERRYFTGQIEYWSMMNVAFEAAGQKGQAQVPFVIDALTRDEAFDKYDANLKAATPGAQQQVRDQMTREMKKQEQKIVLANSLPPSPIRTH